MTRPSWPQYFMSIADAVSRRASCSRLQVGCVLVDTNNRIIATGMNGAPAGQPHCIHPGSENAKGGCAISRHAESNAVAYSVVDPRGSTCYVTASPCVDCLALLENVGVARVVYRQRYGTLQYPDWVSQYEHSED